MGTPANVRPDDFGDILRSFLSPIRAKVWLEHLQSLTDRARGAGVATATPLGVLRSAELGLRGAVDEIRRVTARSMQLQQDAAKATTPAEKRELFLGHLLETVPDRRERRKDEKALGRWLDIEALVDREIERNVAAMQMGMMCLELLRRAYAAAGPESREAWRREHHVRPFLAELATSAFKPPLREEALLTVAGWAHADPTFAAEVDPAPLRAYATERREPTWVQVAALRALAWVAPDAAAEVIDARLASPAAGDDFLVRRNAVLVAFEALRERVPLAALDRVRADPSQHVRQSFSTALVARADDAAVDMAIRVAREDDTPKVRAWALRELVRLAERSADSALGERVGEVLLAVLQHDPAPLVVQVAIDGVTLLKRLGRIASVAPFVPLLEARTEGDPEASERAAAALRALEVAEAPEVVAVREQLERLFEGFGEFETRVLELPPTPENDRVLMRALRSVARGDMGVYVTRVRGAYRLRRGERRVRRLWRFLHEVSRWAPDKRSGFVHTRARLSEGEIICPPIAMCEVTPTPVPGERVLVKQVAGWGPFLPRVDDVLNALGRTEPTYLVTTAGVTVITPPTAWSARARARWDITRKYHVYCEEREHSLRAVDPPDRRKFLETLAKLGVRVERDVEPGTVSGVPYTVKLPVIANFFPAPAATASACFPALLGPLQYFMEESQGNTPAHLALMTFGIYAYLLVRAALVQRGIDVARNAIPLRIGGWGTRGKSGTERLKAGLFQGLGYTTVVKTTGCEAMFIHAVPWQKANEIFLFRPYDKPTIWEQRDVLRTGQAMKAQVFLWECMALRPNFVQLLGHAWMRDEVTTLTNAYPDHEDVMGPTGEEVSRVIGIFMAKNGTTYTTETEMLPILREKAKETNTKLREIPPLEGDLLPDDILKRFPYDEHPRNISLVMAVANHLGIDGERALVEMADNVVPDLGVLKTYPKTSYQGRTVQFANGMSANERAGFLSCWTRLGFDVSDPDERPTEFIITVINNRADRVPRSRVFARIQVRDAMRHGAFCIGTNLTGLVQFIEEELGGWLAEAWVADEHWKPGDPESTAAMLARFDEAMKRVKVPSKHEEVLRIQLAAILRGAGVPEERAEAAVAAHDWTTDPTAMGTKALEEAGLADAVRADALGHLVWAWKRIHDTREARARIAAAKSVDEANQVFRDVYKQIFMAQVHVLWNHLSTGDQVCDRLISVIPPGFSARIMGVQNIKGTGLDFVYRWLSLDSVEQYLRRLEREPEAAQEILAWLASYNYGIVECNHAIDALTALSRALPEALRPVEEQVRTTLEHLVRLKAKLSEGLGEARKPTRLELLAAQVEPWVDFADSMVRRRSAERVQRDFIDRRVGHLGAADLMRDLTKRDKGGWLVKWAQKRSAPKDAKA